jgi:NADH/NAD ratio-sensing transcriptional regulator Rex
MSKVALFGFDERTSGSWRWYADNLDFEVVAVADPDPEKVRQLATDLEVPLCSSLEAMVEEVRFDTLMVTQPLDAAKRATAYALARGIRVHCEVVPECSVGSSRMAILGCDGFDASRLIAAAGWLGPELVAVADSDISETRKLAEELGAFAYESLEGMIEGGGFDALHVSLPWDAAQPAIDYAIEHGIRVVCDVLPEPTLAEMLGSSVPAVVISIDGPATSWEVHLCHHSEPDLVSVILVEIRPGQPPWMTACWSAPHMQSRGDLLVEASRILSVTNRI